MRKHGTWMVDSKPRAVQVQKGTSSGLHVMRRPINGRISRHVAIATQRPVCYTGCVAVGAEGSGRREDRGISSIAITQLPQNQSVA